MVSARVDSGDGRVVGPPGSSHLCQLCSSLGPGERLRPGSLLGGLQLLEGVEAEDPSAARWFRPRTFPWRHSSSGDGGVENIGDVGEIVLGGGVVGKLGHHVGHSCGGGLVTDTSLGCTVCLCRGEPDWHWKLVVRGFF